MPVSNDNPAKSNVTAAVAHLHHFLGAGVSVADDGPLTLIYQANSICDTEIYAMLRRIARIKSEMIDWCNEKSIRLQRPDSRIVIGLIATKSDYEKYLETENLSGLKGSLGLTHPVRLASIVLTDKSELKSFEPVVIATHEMIHQMTIASGICPGWDTWPRWLHEGMAMLGDHAASKDVGTNPKSQSFLELPGFGSVNTERAKAWRKIASGFEMKSFLRRDLLKNPLSHSADYAACWALTDGLARWKKGELLADLIAFLAIQEMQPEPAATVEIVAADWLVNQLGGQWPEFSKSIQESVKRS
ncbi:MAG: DUF1570 domain-containing protein [bacterium]